MRVLKGRGTGSDSGGLCTGHSVLTITLYPDLSTRTGRVINIKRRIDDLVPHFVEICKVSI